MRYRLLGRVELWDDKRVDLGGTKHRTLLASLLFSANEFQSVDRLAAALWDHDRPRSAANLVRVYVHQLRKKMGAAGADLLTEPGGYLLRVADGDLDTHIFERETSQARQAMAAGDFALASARFRAALALWHEPIGACVDSPRLERIHGPRLEDMRLSAVEDLVESELALGGDPAPVDRLRPLVEQHPHRERLLGLFMRALHRRGRKVEALAAFRRMRTTLVTELGIEPGGELHRLAQAILADEPGPHQRAEEAPAAPARSRLPAVVPLHPVPHPVPQQVPAGTVDPIGRDAELRRIREFLTGAAAATHASGRTLLISGPPGAGKSTLMFGAARMTRDAFPDGELYADLADTPVHEAQKDFLLALGVSPPAVPASAARRLALYRSVTATRRVLVVVDNVCAEFQVAQLTPTSAGSALVAASDSRLPAMEFASVLEVQGLDGESGLRFLERLLGHRCGGADLAAAQRVVRTCEGLPLALHIVGARLALRPEGALAAFARLLADDDRRLGEFRVEGLDLSLRYRTSYDRLGREEQSLFRCMGWADPDGATVEALAAMTGQRVATVERTVDALVAAHLAWSSGWDRGGRPRYQQPLLIKDFARQLRRWEDRIPLDGRKCA